MRKWWLLWVCCWYMLKQANASYTHPVWLTMAFVDEYLCMRVSCCVCLQPLIQITSQSQARQQRSRGFEGFWRGRCHRTATSHHAVQYDQFWMVDSANSWWTFSCRWSVTKKGKQHNAPRGVCVWERETRPYPPIGVHQLLVQSLMKTRVSWPWLCAFSCTDL